YIPLSQMQTARSVPAIHDITTDLDNPPEFVDVLPLRRDAPNPPEYAGEDAARQQLEAYPDIAPLFLEVPLDRVYETAQQVSDSMGWELVAANLEQGRARVEATDTTRWFGFKDDVVIRIQDTPEGTRVDIRSKS